MSISRCRNTPGASGWVIPLVLAVSLVLGAPAAAQAQAPSQELRAAPAVTPMTERPEILNASEIVRAMVEAYPPVLRDGGIGGTVLVFFFIDETGQVGNAVLERSSGHAQLDQAALDIARLYRFKPAMNRDQVVPVWVMFPLTFRVNPLSANSGVFTPAMHREQAVPVGGHFSDVPDRTALSPLLRSRWEGPC